ncbi:MAG: hypothetical protein Kow00105_06110 [Phycisphaeraceae bacterium]
MAHISSTSLSPPQDMGLNLRQPLEHEQRTALGLLLTGRPAPSDPAVGHFLDFVRAQGLSLNGLWTAFRETTPIVSALLIPGAGRTAVLFLSPVSSTDRAQALTALVCHIVDQTSAEDIRLIQSLLDPHQTLIQQALVDAGFIRLANLIYMRRSSLGREIVATHPDQPIASGGRVLKEYHWDESRRDLFARSIEASYIDTQDCPGLVGIRQIDDIIAGHMAVGRFDPALWTTWYADDEPAGVLLLNPMAERRELELVYLGLSPAFRGQGLGKALMYFALSRAKQLGFTGIHLAVDDANTPALRLYQHIGFRATGSKLAMIGVLKP